jgi:hypothetical protein
MGLKPEERQNDRAIEHPNALPLCFSTALVEVGVTRFERATSWSQSQPKTTSEQALFSVFPDDY